MVLKIIHKILLVFFFFICIIYGKSESYAKNIIPLPISKPTFNTIGKVISNPKFLPLRKPKYLGPFGSNYKYLISKKDRTSFSKAILAAKLGRWSKARKLVENIKPSVAKNFITWLYLRNIKSKADFRFRAIFIRKHHNWPEMNLIRSRAEKFANDGSMSPSERIDWFAMFPPLSGSGLESLANAYKDKGEIDQSIKLAKKAWHYHISACQF